MQTKRAAVEKAFRVLRRSLLGVPLSSVLQLSLQKEGGKAKKEDQQPLIVGMSLGPQSIHPLPRVEFRLRRQKKMVKAESATVNSGIEATLCRCQFVPPGWHARQDDPSAMVWGTFEAHVNGPCDTPQHFLSSAPSSEKEEKEMVDGLMSTTFSVMRALASPQRPCRSSTCRCMSWLSRWVQTGPAFPPKNAVKHCEELFAHRLLERLTPESQSKSGAGSSPGITCEQFRFTFLCPFTRTRMLLAARSKYCEHLPCFDVFNLFHLRAVQAEADAAHSYVWSAFDGEAPPPATEDAVHDTEATASISFRCPVCLRRFTDAEIEVDWFVQKWMVRALQNGNDESAHDPNFVLMCARRARASGGEENGVEVVVAPTSKRQRAAAGNAASTPVAAPTVPGGPTRSPPVVIDVDGLSPF